MNYDIKSVTHAKEILTSRGLQVDVVECIPNQHVYQLRVELPSGNTTCTIDLERSIAEEFNVFAVIIDDSDSILLDEMDV
jgi:hypothetical protein